jgi:hypothetical protein
MADRDAERAAMLRELDVGLDIRRPSGYYHQTHNVEASHASSGGRLKPDMRTGVWGLEQVHYGRGEKSGATTVGLIAQQQRDRARAGLKDPDLVKRQIGQLERMTSTRAPARVGSDHPPGAGARDRATQRDAPDARDAPPGKVAAGKAREFNAAAGQVDPGVITQDLFKEFQADLNKKLIDGQKIDVDGKTGSFTRDAFRMFLTQNKGNEAVLKPLLTKHAAAVQWLVATDPKNAVSPGNIDNDYGSKTEAALEKWMGGDYDLSIAETGTAPGASAPAPR